MFKIMYSQITLIYSVLLEEILLCSHLIRVLSSICWLCPLRGLWQTTYQKSYGLLFYKYQICGLLEKDSGLDICSSSRFTVYIGYFLNWLMPSLAQSVRFDVLVGLSLAISFPFLDHVLNSAPQDIKYFHRSLKIHDPFV